MKFLFGDYCWCEYYSDYAIEAMHSLIGKIIINSAITIGIFYIWFEVL